MKILIVSTLYPDKKHPYRDIFVAEQAIALKNKGHDVRVIYTNKQSSKRVLSKIDRNIVSNSGVVDSYCMDCKTFKELWFPRINKFWYVKAILSIYNKVIIDGWQPEVIYAHFSCWAGIAGIKIGKKYNIPVVIIEHYSGFINGKCGRAMKKDAEYCINNSQAFICVSDNLKKHLIEGLKINKEIQVIPDMLNSEFSYCPLKKNDKFVFCAVGNLNKGKRFNLLIDAFFDVFVNNDEVVLKIAGAGEEYLNLKKQVNFLNLDNKVQFLGKLNRTQTIELYKESNCFVLPSAYETFGIVWREAMAIGRPIITTNHGGFDADTWDDKVGYIIDVDDKIGLEKAMLSMYNNFNLFDGKYISNICLSNYAQDKIIERVLRVLNNAILTYKR